MGLFGGSDRASQLVAEANGESVTKKRLSNTGGRLFTWLRDRPVIDYLEPGDNASAGEQPQYILFNQSKGLRIFDDEVKRTEEYPVHGNYMSVCTITDRRILFVVPLGEGDQVWDFSFEEIDGVAANELDSRHFRLDLKKENHLFTFPINSGYLKGDEIEDIENYLCSTIGLVQLASNDELVKSARDHQENVETYANSPTSVAGLDLSEYLRSDESSQFVFRNRTRGLYVRESDDSMADSRHYTPSSGHSAHVLLTDQRVLFLIGRNRGYRDQSVDYETISWIDINVGKAHHELKLRAADGIYDFAIGRETDRDTLWDAEDYLRDEIGLASKLQASKRSGTGRGSGLSTGSQAPTTINSAGGIDVPNGVDDSPIPADGLAELMREMDSYSFETLVADLWQLQGWTTNVTNESGDMGIDVVAEKNDPIPQKQLIQAKRYQNGNTIGSSKIQQYSSLRQQEPGADSVAVVTTSSFTTQAQEIADQLNVKLVDIDLLCEIVDGLNAYDVVRWHAGSRLSEFEFEQEPTAKDLEPDAESETTDSTPPDSRRDTISHETNGGETSQNEPDPIDEIRRVRELYEEGVISEEEFEVKKQELLDRI